MLPAASLCNPSPSTRDDEGAAQLHVIARSRGPFHHANARIRIEHARTRRSRAATHGAPTRAQVLELVRLAMFDTDTQHVRPYPAAGGIYGAHLYLHVRDVVGLPAGLYYVRHADRALERIAGASDALGDAPVTALIACDTDLLAKKYLDRAPKFALLEAGALVQTLYLAAESQNLRACALGGIGDRAALALTQAQHALFACCVAFSASKS